MELKDAGMILRSLADSWCKEIKIRKDTDYWEGWSEGMDHGRGDCGDELNDLLDKCGVPELEEESK